MSGDDLLRRLQRNACVACVLFAAIALGVSGAGAAAAVFGGGILAGISFLLIKGAILDVTAFAEAGSGEPSPRANTGFALAKLTGRYALLAFLAYVMIARLRLHPIGLIAGASSFVAVAAVEAARLFRNK